jgi:solute carrier family 45 protein 1/2/4
MALVWIAGPLSGTLVQPYIGILSDNCRISWGKRKPFMIGGTLGTIMSFLMLAWAKEIVQGFLGIFGADPESEGVKTSIIVFAVLFVYILDFSINTVQAGIRAFIVDCAPTHQQEDANAWAGRVTGVGNIIGYVSGYIDLPRVMWFFGNTEFKVLCVIASLALGITVAISCVLIKERNPNLSGPPPKGRGGVLGFFVQVFKSIRRLPPQTRRVCEVQFFAWIGWFPFLFYITTYIGEIYVQPFLRENPHMAEPELHDLYEKATRIGTFALLIYAITSFLANVLLPFFVVPSYTNPSLSKSMRSSKSYTTRFTRLIEKLTIPWLTLRRAWLLSHILFAVCMWLTFFVTSTAAATALTGLVGISWALTLWAPFALISAEVSKRDAMRRQGRLSDENLDDEAGIILGIHNVAIASPQIISTFGSSLVFKLLQKPRGTPGDNSVGWVLRLGGIATIIAAYWTLKVKEERDSPEPIDVGDGIRSGRLLARD